MWRKIIFQRNFTELGNAYQVSQELHWKQVVQKLAGWEKKPAVGGKKLAGWKKN